MVLVNKLLNLDRTGQLDWKPSDLTPRLVWVFKWIVSAYDPIKPSQTRGDYGNQGNPIGFI